jgi:hypothetical protein
VDKADREKDGAKFSGNLFGNAELISISVLYF